MYMLKLQVLNKFCHNSNTQQQILYQCIAKNYYRCYAKDSYHYCVICWLHYCHLEGNKYTR